MPDAWDFTQKPQQAGPAMQIPLLTYLLTGLSILMTLPILLPTLLPGNLWEQWVGFVLNESEGSGPRSLLTNIFIHGSWLHLIFNMVWLVQMGRILEKTLNPVVYLTFIVGAAAVGSGCQMLISGDTGIGMSGVIYAMFGLMWAGRSLYPIWGMIASRDNLRLFIGWGLFCVIATYFHILHIANGAHGGGFLFGLSIGFLFFVPRRRWIWAAPLSLLIGVTVFSAIRLHMFT